MSQSHKDSVLKAITDFENYNTSNYARLHAGFEGIEFPHIMHLTGLFKAELNSAISELVRDEQIVMKPGTVNYMFKTTFDKIQHLELLGKVFRLVARMGRCATLEEILADKHKADISLTDKELKAFLEQNFIKVPFIRLNGSVQQGYAYSDLGKGRPTTADPEMVKEIAECIHEARVEAKGDYLKFKLLPGTHYVKGGVVYSVLLPEAEARQREYRFDDTKHANCRWSYTLCFY